MSAPVAATPWYADGLRFACVQCGACCSGAPGYVWVDGDEIDRIAAFLEMSPKQFNRRHIRRVGRGRSLLELPGGDCEFLERLPNHGTRCRIHPVRPTQCRTWPFWRSNLTTLDAWQRTARACPGIGTGPHYSFPIIQQALADNGQRPL